MGLQTEHWSYNNYCILLWPVLQSYIFRILQHIFAHQIFPFDVYCTEKHSPNLILQDWQSDIRIEKMELLASLLMCRHCYHIVVQCYTLEYKISNYILYHTVWLQFLRLCLLQYGNSCGMIDTYPALNTVRSGIFSSIFIINH
jgi:hypothetical protein